MHETPDELTALQRLLDASRVSSTGHLRSIIDDDRALHAADLVALLTGMRVLSFATTTAGGEPRISALDGHFLHGTWSFSTSASSAKGRQVRARPAVSVAHVDGEALAVFSHGVAVPLREDDEGYAETLEHWIAHYGASPFTWGDDVVLYRYRPTWMVGYAADRAGLLAARGLTPA